jgi:BolA protein
VSGPDTLAQIRDRLATLAPTSLEIGDDSALHAGHAGAAGGGGHYHLRIVSEQFVAQSAVARHRIIYRALGDLMGSRIHALAIEALTPDEFNLRARAS